MSILYRAYGSTADCLGTAASTTYATARSSTAATTSAAATVFNVGQIFSSPTYTISQGFYQFDTSTFPASGSGSFSLNATVVASVPGAINEVSETTAITSKIAGGSLGSLTQLGSWATTGTTGRVVAALSAVTVSATLRYVCSAQNERLNVAPTVSEQQSYNSADISGTTNDPYVQVLAGTVWDHVSIGTSVEVTATTHTLIEPAGVAAGDLLVACIASRIASTTAITLPAGWTRVGQALNNNVLTTSSALPSGMMAYIIRGGSAPSYTFTHPVAPAPALGRVIAYRGVHQTVPLDTGVTQVTTGTALLAVSVAGLTTTVDDDLIVALCAGGQEAAWQDFAATDPVTGSGTTASSVLDPIWGQWLERADVQTTTSNDTSLAIFDAVKQTAGATGNLIATASVSAGHVVVAGSFRLALPTPTSFGDIIQFNTGTSTTATTSPTLPAATTAGSLVVLTFAADDYNATVSSGWTESSEMEQQTFHGGYLWWLAATAGMTIPSYTVASAVRSTWTLVEYKGPVDSGSYDGSQGVFQQTTADTITTDPLTPTSGNRLLVAGLQAQASTVEQFPWTTFTGSFAPVVQSLFNGGNPRLSIVQLRRAVTANGSTAYTTGGTETGGPLSRSAHIIAFKQAASGNTYNDAITEATTAAAETVSAQYDLAGPIAEAGAAAETVASLLDATRVVAETAAAAEALAGTLVTDKAIAETAAAAETLTGGLAFNIAVAETAAAADTITKTLTYTGAIAETASAADTVGGLLVAIGAVAETAAAAEATDASVVPAAGIFDKTVAETASAADTLGGLLVTDKAIAETAAAAETLAGQITFTGAVAETAAAAETITKTLNFTGAIAETAAAAETVGGLLTRVGAIAETASAADTPAGLLAFTGAIAEVASAAETIVPIVVPAGGTLYEDTVLETLAATDTFSAAGMSSAGVILETLAANDTVVADLIPGTITPEVPVIGGPGPAGEGVRRRYEIFLLEDEDEDGRKRTKEDKDGRKRPKRRLRLKKEEIEEKVEAAVAHIAAGSPQPMSQNATVAQVSTLMGLDALLEIDRRRVERTIYQYLAAMLEEEEEEGMAMMLLAA